MRFKENRLIFQEKPPEKEQDPTPTSVKTEKAPEKPQVDPKAQQDHAGEIGEELMGPPIEAANDSLVTRSPEYDKALEETPKEKREKLRQRIITDESIGESDLQGGYEWLGLKEEDQDRKHSALGSAYLDKKGDSLVVKQELNDHKKTKFGLGAGDLLPPSITAVTVVDRKGRKRSGTRQIVNGRVGYYTDSGRYIPIFAGYRITPHKYIQEDSKEYKAVTKKEVKIYQDRENAIDQEQAETASTPEDVVNYVDQSGTTVGRIDTPVSSLSSLRTKTPTELKTYFEEDGFKPGQAKESIERIEAAKLDLKRIDAITNHFGIGLHADSEVRGGSYLVALGGKGAEMLGWNSACDEAQKEYLTKLTDPKLLEEVAGKGEIPVKLRKDETLLMTIEKDGDKFTYKVDGKRIPNIENWCYEKAGKLAKKTKTTELILAMQIGQKFKGVQISDKGYWRLNLSELGKINELANSDEAFKAKVAQIKERPVPPHKLLEITPVVGGKTMSREEALAYGIRGIYENPRDRRHFDTMYRARMRGGNPRVQPGSVNYNWNAHAGRLNHPNRGGEKCCADMVSDIMGIAPGKREGTDGRSNNVSVLASRLMETNRETIGNDGIVFGFENYQQGDVVIWSHGNKTTLTHIGIVRCRLTIDGQDYVAIQHDSSNIQVDIIPVNKGVPTRGLSNQLRSGDLVARQKPEDQRKLKEILAYRSSNPKTVRIRSNSGTYGDRSKGRGSILYAVRTAHLQPKAVA